MKHRWSEEDSAEHKERIAYADMRIEGWARWSGYSDSEGLDFSGQSSVVNAMMPSEEEQQAGARHCASECSDDEAMQVDAVICRWKVTDPRYVKIVHKEYRTSGPSEKKARELGMNRNEYRRQLDLMRMEMYRALDSGARKNKFAGTLGAQPAKNARD